MAERTRPPLPTDPPLRNVLAEQERLIYSPGVLQASHWPAKANVAAALSVRIDPADETLTLTLRYNNPQQATATLNAIVNAYLKAAAPQQDAMSQKLNELAAQRDKVAADRDARAKALLDFRKESNLSGTSADGVVTARRDQLAAALAAANKDLTAAQAEADAAAKLPADPVALETALQRPRTRGVFAALDAELRKAKSDLDSAETELEEQRKTLLSQHPLILQTQRKIAQLRARVPELEQQYPQVYRDHCARELAAAKKKVAELSALLEQQTERTQQSATGTQKIAELEAELKKADAAVAEADQKMREATVTADAPVRMKLVQAPTAPQRPSHPRRDRALLWAGGIGLLLGLMLAGRR